MTRVADYRQALESLDDWRPYLMKHSGLPGPRGNLELAHAAAELADREQVDTLLSAREDEAPENSPRVFLVFCGVTALGKMAARGEPDSLRRLRGFASDTRWRIREAVAIGLQYMGEANMPALLHEMEAWAAGNWYEKRAAAAALAEPRLLKDPDAATRLLHLLNSITAEIASAKDRREEPFRVLRQAMGYCWSVAVVAHPSEGKRLMEKWLASSDPDVRWIMRENLKKSRLVHLDSPWVERWRQRLEERT